MEQYKSMFEAAVKSLVEIDYALGIGDDGCSDTEQTLFAIAELRGQIAWAEEFCQWVSVDNRLPTPDTPVLVHNGKWTGVGLWCADTDLEPTERWQDECREFIAVIGPAVTHWMPLPPPPNVEVSGRPYLRTIKDK